MIDESPEGQISRAVAILKNGGVTAFPTDTVYGLGAAMSSTAGVERVYTIKKRPHDQALPVLLATVEQISEVATDVPAIAWLLAKRFMPGGLTLVLKRSPKVPALVAGGGDTIAVRVPNHPVPLAFIRGLGEPITGTSANLSGSPAGKTAAEVIAQLGSHLDCIIDAGPAPNGTESTIVDVTGDSPVILREGAIARTQIEPVLREATVGARTSTSGNRESTKH